MSAFFKKTIGRITLIKHQKWRNILEIIQNVFFSDFTVNFTINNTSVAINPDLVLQQKHNN